MSQAVRFPAILFVLLALSACQGTSLPATPAPSPTPAPTATLTHAQLIGKSLKGWTAPVYRLMPGGHLRHLRDWSTFLAYGYLPADVITLPPERLAAYSLDLPLTQWVIGQTDRTLYFLQYGKRYAIPDMETLEVLGGSLLTVSVIPDDLLDSFPKATNALPPMSRSDPAHPPATAALWADGALWTATGAGGATRWEMKPGRLRPAVVPLDGMIHALARYGTHVIAGTHRGQLLRLTGEASPKVVTSNDSAWIAALESDLINVWRAEVNHYDAASGQYRLGRGLVRLSPAGTETAIQFNSSASDDSNPLRSITTLAFDSKANALWVGTRFAGLLHYDLTGQTWQHFDTFNSPIPDNAIRAVRVGPDGAVWLALASGVARFRGGQWETFSLGDGLTDRGAFAVTVAADGTVWASGENFVARIGPDGSRQTFGAFAHPLLLDDFSHIALDDQEHPWIVGRRNFLHFDGRSWLAYDAITGDGRPFQPGELPAGQTAPPAAFPAPAQDYAGWLKTWPRPQGDNGRCIHYLQFPSGEEYEVRQQIERMRRLGIRWTIVNYTGRQQLLRMAPRFAGAGITVVWRPFVRPYQVYPHWAEDVAFLRALGIPPYMQIYNEPSLGQEWDAGRAIDQELYLKNLLPAVQQVYDAGGYVGLQHIDTAWLRATLQRLKSTGMANIFDRLFFVPHPYGFNHPPDYDKDGDSVLGFQAFAKVFQDEIGFVPVMIAGEGGWRPGEQQDKRFPAVSLDLHRDYHVAVFDWFRTGILSNKEPLPDYLLAFCPWLIADPTDPAAWFDSTAGERPLTVHAIEALPGGERCFAWQAGK